MKKMPTGSVILFRSRLMADEVRRHHPESQEIQNNQEDRKMHEMSHENLEAVTGGIVVSRAKEIYKYLSDEDKKKVEEMEKEMLEKMNK